MRSVVFLQNRNFYGNKLIHIPLLHALKQEVKSTRIDVFSPYKSGQLFRKIGLADSVHTYSRDFFSILRKLREIKPDLILSLRPSSQWLDLAIGFSGARIKLGFKTLLSRTMFSHTITRNVSIYRALDFIRLLEPLGVRSELGSFFMDQSALADLHLPPDREWFCFIPGGGAGEHKRWSLDHFFELSRMIKKDMPKASFIFILGDKEKDYIEKIKASSLFPDGILLFKEKIANLSRVFISSRMTIANDCGPAQIAQMMMVPYVGIFSDEDSRAEELMQEWYFPHDRSAAVVSDRKKDINSVPAARVYEALSRLL